GLLAHVMVSKYLDHCPLARQSRIFARQGVALSRQTLCDWVLDATELLAVLMPALQRHVLSSPVIFTDDTTLALQAPGKTITARMWVYLAGGQKKDDEGQWQKVAPAALYDFTADRSGTHPRRILGAWRGYLQADDYSGYHASFREGVT
ncbi:IS66 family transposase, partial [Thauera sp. ZXT1-4]